MSAFRGRSGCDLAAVLNRSNFVRLQRSTQQCVKLTHRYPNQFCTDAGAPDNHRETKRRQRSERERMLTNDDELCRHPDLQEVEKELESGPSRHLPETEGAGGDDEGIPCCDSERANEEVLVRGQVRWEIELVREHQSGSTGVGHGGEGRRGGGGGRR